MGQLVVPQTGVNLFRGEVFLSSLDYATTTTGAAITLNASPQSVLVADSTKFNIGDSILVDTGAAAEIVAITAKVDGTHLSGIFTKNHLISINIAKNNPQNVPVAQIQEFDFDDTIDLKEMRGPRSRFAVAVAQSGAKVSGSCKFGAMNPQILQVIRGALVATATIGGNTVTKVTRKGAQNTVPVAIELFDVDNQYGVHALFAQVVFTDFKNPQKLDDFTIWDASFNAYPDKTSDILYELFFPGDQTAPYTLPSGYTADTDLATVQANYEALKMAGTAFE